jgi:hypothetical protein
MPLTIEDKIKLQQNHAEAVKLLLADILAPVVSDHCRYSLEPGGWLSIEYRAPLNNQPQSPADYKFYLLFAANIYEMTLKQIQNKIIIMLFDRCRSLKQDINGLMEDYTLTRK